MNWCKDLFSFAVAPSITSATNFSSSQPPMPLFMPASFLLQSLPCRDPLTRDPCTWEIPHNTTIHTSVFLRDHRWPRDCFLRPRKSNRSDVTAGTLTSSAYLPTISPSLSLHWGAKMPSNLLGSPILTWLTDVGQSYVYVSRILLGVADLW